MPRADSEFAIRTEGLAKLNRDLGKISKDLRKDSLRELREIGKKVRSTARPLAPVRTGALARSYRYSATNRGASVRSALPYAPVIEYGRTISPKGVPIEFKESRPLGKAVQTHASDIEDQIGDLLDGIARRNGFR